MKKFFSTTVAAALMLATISVGASAETIKTTALGKGVYAIGIKCEVGEGNVICDALQNLIPEINFPELDTNLPSGDTDVIFPEQDNDTIPEEDTNAPSEDSSLHEYETEVVRLVNEIRADNGLKELEIDAELSRIARLKSQDMKDNNYFAHTSPVYGSAFDMMKSFGISYISAGENIAKGQKTPQIVVNAWMNSPGHRANILNAFYNRIGVGYVADGNYWTQMFIQK